MKKNKTLFVSLQSLYSKIFNAILRIRMHSYHPSVKVNNNIDVTTLLNKQVEKLAESSAKIKAHPVIYSKEEPDLKKIFRKPDNITQDDRKKQYDNREESEFSKYLNQTKSSSTLHPHMGDQLEKSAWEHVHKAIRFARQGNVATAKLHADIAGHALEEAKHYLENDEYSELIFQIEECFIKSK